MLVEGAEGFYKGQYLHHQFTETDGIIDNASKQEAVHRKDRSEDAQVHKEEHPRVHVAKRGGSETNETR
jgi:demethoxyubiquinone hydroxylase (CLK1/Coq7/Cat5 family)